MQTFITEILKLKRSRIVPLLAAGPVLVFLQALVISPPDASGLSGWLQLYSFSIVSYAILFYPLLTGVLSAFVCRFEHANGGWKQLLAYPVSRTKLFFSKLGIVLALLALIQLLMMAGVLIAGLIQGIAGPVPWIDMFKSAGAGWIAAWPLAALQLWISIFWRSFGGALAVNVIFALPAIFAANSETFGPYYPWAQPLLAMLPREADNLLYFNVPLETLLYVIVGGFLLAVIAGWLTFVRRDVHA